MAHRRVRVTGIKKCEIDTDKLALAYWLMAKHAVDEKRKREVIEAKDRRAPRGDGRHARG